MPDYSIRRETFPFYSIEYVTCGGGRLKLGRRNFELHPGTVFSYVALDAIYKSSHQATPVGWVDLGGGAYRNNADGFNGRIHVVRSF